MVLDTTELTDRIYSLVQGITPNVFKYRSPNNQKGTYIVVTPLALVGVLDQTAIVNVNLHVDNLKLNINGHNDHSQPNAKVFRDLLPVLNRELIRLWENNELITLEQSNMIYEDTQTFVNIRVKYRKINYK